MQPQYTPQTRPYFTLPAPIRFWAKINRQSGRSWNGTPCWEWTGKIRPDGYARFGISPGVTEYAHRYAYMLLVGTIPPDLTLDHLCRNRCCVNPDHLEPVTRGENVLRGEGFMAQQKRQTHCKYGHLFDEANTRIYRGQRKCRECDRLRHRAKKQAA